jgi:gamma-glutamyl:cysteine ligase YbdK (ATP-grasp superfamily)
MTGCLVDLETGIERSAGQAIEELLAWSAPAAARLGLDRFLGPVRSMLEMGNGATRQLRRYDELGGDLHALHAECVERTKRSAEELLAELEGSDS